jgi:hypothetical protein
MLHACFYTICLVFCYTSWHFYVFFGTNLLTRCYTVSSLFPTVFVFQKFYTGNILGIGRNKSQTSRYFTELPEDRRGDGAEPEGGHTIGQRGLGWPAPPGGVGPRSTSDAAPSPIKTPRREKPKALITFPEHIAIRHCRRPKIGRVQKLFPVPCRRGKSPPEVFFIVMLASGTMSE